jgi:chromosome segregation ATPase
VDPGKSKQLAVIEERMTSQTVSASNLSADTIALYMRSTVVKQAVKDALQKLVALKQKAADAKAQRVLLEGQVQAITQEQARIRANMGELDHGNALYNRYVTQLNDQENQLAALQESITKARAEEAARQKDVDAFLLGMDVS